MTSITGISFLFGAIASAIGLYVLKRKRWVDISKYSFEVIETDRDQATCLGVFILTLGIILIVLGFVSMFIMR